MDSTATIPIPDFVLPTFAKGTISLLHIWPALRIAISQGWGGPQGRTHLAEDIVDLFYTTASEAVSSTSTVTAATALVPEQDDIEAVLLHVLSHEFSLTLEDGSEATIARDLVGLWRECVGRAVSSPPYQPGMLERFEAAAVKAKLEDGAQRYGVQREGGEDSEGSDDESGEDSDEEMGELVEGEDVPAEASGSRHKDEPMIDEDGFQTVTKKGGRR
jgi:pre-rRNA-processing protein TSR2